MEAGRRGKVGDVGGGGEGECNEARRGVSWDPVGEERWGSGRAGAVSIEGV